MLTVNIFASGKPGKISKGDLTPVMDEIGRIGLKHQDYAVIDYTLCEDGEMFDGNFSIDEADRRIRGYQVRG